MLILCQVLSFLRIANQIPSYTCGGKLTCLPCLSQEYVIHAAFDSLSSHILKWAQIDDFARFGVAALREGLLAMVVAQINVNRKTLHGDICYLVNQQDVLSLCQKGY